MPTCVVVYPAEPALPPLNGTLAKPDRAPTRLGPAHDVSPGPYRAKVTVPVGLNPPVTCALSLMTTPTFPETGNGVVAIEGVARWIITCSALHPLTAGLLLASPLYEATHR